MKVIFSLLSLIILHSYCYAQQNLPSAKNPYALVIHGGAGGLRKGQISADKEVQYKNSLKAALQAGYAILEKGGLAIDAIQAAINVLEDDSLFNAGKGAVFADNGMNELDASIMDGSDLNAGAVAGVTTVKNPISAARMVMEKSEHVMLSGRGAEVFVEKAGCEIVHPSYFSTQKSKAKFKQAKENKGKKSMLGQPGNVDDKYGTVGAVALDKHGNLAAGTSTGGMSGKKYNRIGDSPIIGAGTYADNNSCAVSCTGWGEYFIRLGMAKAICDRVELVHMPVDEAARLMIHDKLDSMKATGGIIAIDKLANISIQFNTTGMHRAWMKSDGEHGVEIYGMDK